MCSYHTFLWKGGQMIGGGPGGSKFKVYVKVMKIFASSLKGPGKISTLYTIPPSPKTKHIVRFGHFWPRPSLLFAVILIMTKIPKKKRTLLINPPKSKFLFIQKCGRTHNSETLPPP